MSVATPPPDPEIAAEQAALDHALESLGAMRQRAEELLADLVAAGNPDLDYVAALSRRVTLLADSQRPLLFGRIDEEDGPTWRIGRRHVEDVRSDPVVIDWRAPVAVPFYRASPKDALGLARRRQIMVDRGAVMAVADDLFATRAAMPAPPGSAAGMPSWPSSSAPERAKCSTSSPPFRPNRTRSSGRLSTNF
jgi:hypothetical protein